MEITELIEGLRALRYAIYKFSREDEPDMPIDNWVDAFGEEVKEYETLYQMEKETEK